MLLTMNITMSCPNSVKPNVCVQGSCCCDGAGLLIGEASNLHHQNGCMLLGLKGSGGQDAIGESVRAERIVKWL